jgi:hypothetical protein
VVLPRAGTRVVSVAMQRSLPAGRYAVRATGAGATLSFSARLPAAR